MSNALAIAAVTATLRALLQTALTEVAGIQVTTLTPDKAEQFEQNDGPGRINLVLYQTTLNAAWRNQNVPQQVKPGETGQPPLALDLHYLISAYQKNTGNGHELAHQILGRAMRTLHDHPLLFAEEIKLALPESDLGDQVERVRITPQPLSLDEMSKLWMIFQTSYRISAAYQVQVVLIESNRTTRAPLPVLTRGKDDSGVVAQPDLIPPFPTLTSVLPDAQPPGSEATAVLGDDLLLEGHHLDGSSVTVQITHPRLPEPLELPASGVPTAKLIKVSLALDPDVLPPGVCTVGAVITRAGETFPHTTNEMPLSFAPTILDFTQHPSDIVVRFSPQVWPQQRISLLLGEYELQAQPRLDKTDELLFVTTGIGAGDYFVRLRVDGVDSLLVDRSVRPPKFDETQMVTIP